MDQLIEAAPRPADEPIVAEPNEPAADVGNPSLRTPELTRRGFLRGAAITGGGLMAATLAACAPATQPPGWTFGPTGAPAPGSPTPGPATPAPSAAATVAPTAAPSGIPSGWSSHDLDARNVVRRYIGNLAPALKDIYGDAAFAKLADILGAADGYPELQRKPAFAQVPQLFLNDVLLCHLLVN